MALADDIAALKAAIRKGVKSVSYDGHMVTYQSTEEMRATLADMERELSGQRVTRTVYDTTRGFR